MTVLEHWVCTNCGTVDGARAGLKCHGPGFTGICLALGETVVEINPGAFKQLQGAVDLAERYGQAIVDISAALSGPGSINGGRVIRARAIIASLDTTGGQ